MVHSLVRRLSMLAPYPTMLAIGILTNACGGMSSSLIFAVQVVMMVLRSE